MIPLKNSSILIVFSTFLIKVTHFKLVLTGDNMFLYLAVYDTMNASEPDSSFLFERKFILQGFSYE
jgi:hypothetical protein